jgi:hypothetical protein
MLPMLCRYSVQTFQNISSMIKVTCVCNPINHGAEKSLGSHLYKNITVWKWELFSKKWFVYIFARFCIDSILYSPRNEVVGGILVSPCPSVCPSVVIFLYKWLPNDFSAPWFIGLQTQVTFIMLLMFWNVCTEYLHIQNSNNYCKQSSINRTVAYSAPLFAPKILWEKNYFWYIILIYLEPVRLEDKCVNKA